MRKAQGIFAQIIQIQIGRFFVGGIEMKDQLSVVKKFVFTSIIVLGLVGSAGADMIDLTTVGSDGWLGDVYFLQIDPETPMGTGVINAFLGIQGTKTKDPTVIEKGYNTNGKLEFDTKPGVHTKALLLSEVPEVTIGGTTYREFVLDINEDISELGRFLTLENFKIHITSNENITGYPQNFPAAVYEMDTPSQDNKVLLNAALDTGSGGGDMLTLIPSSLFGTDETKYVNLYSEFSNYEAGFEEWAVGANGPIIPEPTTLALIAMGGGLAVLRRKRK